MSASSSSQPPKLVEGQECKGYKVTVVVLNSERRGYGRSEDDSSVAHRQAVVYPSPEKAAKKAMDFYNRFIAKHVYELYYDDLKPGDGDASVEQRTRIQNEHRARITGWPSLTLKEYGVGKRKKACTLKFQRHRDCVKGKVGHAFVELTPVRAIAVLKLKEID